MTGDHCVSAMAKKKMWHLVQWGLEQAHVNKTICLRYKWSNLYGLLRALATCHFIPLRPKTVASVPMQLANRRPMRAVLLFCLFQCKITPKRKMKRQRPAPDCT
ncbi:hypothetical protein TcCL_NonESM03281 [Trypanosoma cruzi]|nr:hypothetical protein TcCL_NonESM03281 [Trypanosoma cruzi]